MKFVNITLGEITCSFGGGEMSNLHFELFLEKMDWNTEDFRTDVTHLKSYEIPNVLLTEKIIA